jgi:hypothetical protein
LGGIVKALWISGKVFHAFVNETVIIMVGGEALLVCSVSSSMGRAAGLLGPEGLAIG